MSAATSDAVLARLTRLHPKLIDLSLGRIEGLLAALGNPHERLPPVIHVAGTNGKGSVVATMRACLEAGGYRVHAYISPHLVRFHERIRLAGKLIEEGRLIELLEECERANRGAPITYFEITTAAAFLAFARTPADIVLARNRARRPARRDQRDPSPGGDRDHPDLARPPGLSRRHDRRDRRRESRHPETGFAGHHRPADSRGSLGVRRARRSDRRPALSLRPGMALRSQRRRHALRRPALATRSAAALVAWSASDRQFRHRDRLPRTARRLPVVARSDRRRVAPHRLAGAIAAPDPWSARRDDAC